MSETVDDLTVTYHEGELMTVKELDKVVLSKGAWATIMFRYQDLDRKTGEFGPDKYTMWPVQTKRIESLDRSLKSRSYAE